MAMTLLHATATVLIVDNHPITRAGYKHIFESQSDLVCVGEADGLAEAMHCYHEQPADIVLSDISLADGTGLELTHELLGLNPDARVLISSNFDEILYAERSLRAGAKGYINKHEPTDRILGAVRRVLQGQVYLSDEMTDRMLCRSIGRTQEQSQTPIDTLSDRELQVFEQIGRGQTTRSIAAQMYLSPKTIETYRENIKSKLNLHNATELTQHAVRWVMELN